MNEPDRIQINSVEYVRADAMPAPATGTRVVLVVDRGYIYAGDLSQTSDGYWRLDRAVHVRRWEAIGWDGLLADPKSTRVTIKPLAMPVEVPQNSVISRHPVPDNWGL